MHLLIYLTSFFCELLSNFGWGPFSYYFFPKNINWYLKKKFTCDIAN